MANVLERSQALVDALGVNEAPVVDSTPTEFNRGLRSGWLGAGSQLQSFAGGTGAALGFDKFAANRARSARQLQEEAEEAGPRIKSYRDVDPTSLRDIVDYSSGVFGQAVPSVGAAIAAGAATAATGGGALAGLAAGALTQFPLEAGDIFQRQMLDPESQQRSAMENAARAYGGGAASSIGQSIVPAAFGGKLLGQGVKAAERGVVGGAERGALRAAETPGALPRVGVTEADIAAAQNLEARAAAQRALQERGAPGPMPDNLAVAQSADAQAAAARAMREQPGSYRAPPIEPAPRPGALPPIEPAPRPPVPAAPIEGPLKFPDTFDPAALPKVGGEVNYPHSPMPGLTPEGVAAGAAERTPLGTAGTTISAKAAVEAEKHAAKAASAAEKAAAAAAKAAQPGMLRQLGGAALKDSAIEAGSEGGGELVKQYATNENNPIDWQAVGENALAGGIVGAPMGAGGHLAESFHQNKADFGQNIKNFASKGADLAKTGYQKGKEGLAGAAAGAYGAPGAVADAAPGALDKAMDVAGKVGSKIMGAAGKVSETLAGKDTSGLADNAGKMTKEAYRAAVKRATDMVDRFQNTGKAVDDSIDKAVVEGSPLAGVTEEERETLKSPVADDETKNTILDNAKERVTKWAKEGATELAQDEGASEETRQRAAAIAEDGGSVADKMWLGAQKTAGVAKKAAHAAIDAIGRPVDEFREARADSMEETDVASKAMLQAKEQALAGGASEEEANTAALVTYNEELEKAGERLLQIQEEKARSGETPKQRAAKKRTTLGIKKSEDVGDEEISVLGKVPHVVRAIQEHLMPLLPESMKDGSPGSLLKGAEFVAKVRKFLNTASQPAGHNFLQLEHDAEAIRNALGGDPEVVDNALMKVYAQAMFEDPKAMQQLTSTLQESRKAGVNDRQLLSVVTHALQAGNKSMARAWMQTVKEYAAGRYDQPQEMSKAGVGRVQNAAIAAKMKDVFGERYEEVLDAAERNMTQARMRAEMVRKGGLDSDEDGTKGEGGNPFDAPASDHEQYFKNATKLLAAPKRKSKGDPWDNSTAKLEDELMAKFPNAEVQWVSERERTGDDKAPANEGQVRVRQQAQEGELDYSGIRKMRLDVDRQSRAQKEGTAPSSRINVSMDHAYEKPSREGGKLTPEQEDKNEALKKALGLVKGQGLILDAVKIATLGMDAVRASTKSDGASDAVRRARGFFNGMAQVADKLGVMPEIGENTLLGYVNEEPFTFKDAMKLDLSGPDDVRADRARDQESANRKLFTEPVRQWRKRYHDAKTNAERAAIVAEATPIVEPLLEKLQAFNAASDDVNSERVGKEHERQSGESVDLARRDLVEGLLAGEGRYEIPDDANIHELAVTTGDRAPMFAGGNPWVKKQTLDKNGKETGTFERNEFGEVVYHQVEQPKKGAQQIGTMDTGGAGSTSFQQSSNRPGQRGRSVNVHPWAMAIDQLREAGGIAANVLERAAELALKRNAHVMNDEQRAALNEAMGGNKDEDGKRLPTVAVPPKGDVELLKYAYNGWLGKVSVAVTPGKKDKSTVSTKNYGDIVVSKEMGDKINKANAEYQENRELADPPPLDVAKVAKVVNSIYDAVGSQLAKPGVEPVSMQNKPGKKFGKNKMPIDEEGLATKATGRSEIADEDIEESTRMPRDREVDAILPKQEIARDPNYKGKDQGTYGPNLQALIDENKAAGLHDNAYGQQYTEGGEKLKGNPHNAPYFGPVESKTGPKVGPDPNFSFWNPSLYEHNVMTAAADSNWFRNYHDREEYLKGIEDSDGLAQLERLRQGVKQFRKDGTIPTFPKSPTISERAQKPGAPAVEAGKPRDYQPAVEGIHNKDFDDLVASNEWRDYNPRQLSHFLHEAAYRFENLKTLRDKDPDFGMLRASNKGGEVGADFSAQDAHDQLAELFGGGVDLNTLSMAKRASPRQLGQVQELLTQYSEQLKGAKTQGNVAPAAKQGNVDTALDTKNAPTLEEAAAKPEITAKKANNPALDEEINSNDWRVYGPLKISGFLDRAARRLQTLSALHAQDPNFDMLGKNAEAASEAHDQLKALFSGNTSMETDFEHEAMVSKTKIANLQRKLDNHAADFREGPQRPKAVAAKKAALEKAASSSSPELIQEIRTTTDAPALQKTVNHLTAAKPVENVPSAGLNDVLHMVAEASRHGDVARLKREAAAMRAKLDDITATKLDSLVAHRAEAMGLTKANEIVSQMAAKGAKLGDILTAIEPHLPPRLQAVAQAIRATGAGDTAVGHFGKGEAHNFGHMGQFNRDDRFNPKTGLDSVPGVRLNPEGKHFAATVLLHEGVHAATMSGMETNPTIKAGMEALMGELKTANPSLGLEYGFKDAYEFAAEVMTNPALQERLKAMPASAEAGKLVKGATMWDKFLSLVKKALGISSTDNSALSQALGMTSQAMEKTKADINYERTIEEANARLDELMQDPDNAYNSVKYSHDDERRGLFVGEHDDGFILKDDTTGEHISIEHPLEDPNTSVFKTEADAKQALADYNERKYSADSHQTTTGAGPRDVKGALAYLHKVLRNSIGVDVNALLGKGVAGTWDPLRSLIEISAKALNVKSVAYHESLHAFFTQLYRSGSGKVADVLMKAAQSPHVQQQMREYFKNQPAVLRSMSADPEEAAAYMFQLWMQGDLKLNPQATNIFSKIAGWIRNALGMWSNDQRALHIMEHFSSGEYAKNIGKPNMAALMGKGTNPAYEMSKKLFSPALNLGEKLFASGNSRLRDMGIPAMNEIADLVKTKLISRKGDPGFMAAARQEHMVRMNKLADDIGNISPATQTEALAELQGGVAATTTEGKAAVATIRQHFEEMLNYIDPTGKLAGGLPNYFPRVWDVDTLTKDPKSFLSMIEKYQRSGQFKGDAKELLRTLTANDGNDFAVDTRVPGFQSGKQRLLAFISNADAAPFLNKDLYKTMNDYTSQATRRTEFGKRFGEDGSYLDELMDRAEREGASKEQLAIADNFIKGVTGTLGDGISPEARRMMGNITVYQNLRLLPLAAFSSVVDPLGILVRGGTISDAWDAYKRIARDIPKVFKDSGLKDWQTELSETLGVVENATLMHAVGALYTQGMVGNFARKMNDTFFKYNFMETINRSTRIGATEASLKFMQRHAQTPNDHSARYFDELGLHQSDIQINPVTGRVKTTVDEGLTQEHADRMRMAVHQWVDGAVLRPDNADRPVWFNDPHFMLVSHLKSFTYSFHHTIIDRVLHEAKHGNYQPMAVMASYVPVMIVADYMKGMIQGGGDQPAWKKDWGPSDYLWSGVQRGGLLGVGQFGADVAEGMRRGHSGLGSLSGPTLEQLGDAIDVAGGRQRFGTFALDAMPANALYSWAFKGGGPVRADPHAIE